MSLISSVKKKIHIEATKYLAAAAENLMQRMGGTINYLCDTTDTHTTNIATINTELTKTMKTLLVGPYSASQGINGGPTVQTTVASITTRNNPVFVWWIKGTHLQVNQLGPSGYEFRRNGVGVAQCNPRAGATVIVDDAAGALLASTGIGSPAAFKLGNTVDFQYDTGPFKNNLYGTDFIAQALNAYHVKPILLHSEAASLGTAITFEWAFVDQVTFTNDYYLIMY